MSDTSREERIAAALAQHDAEGAALAIVLGSGLGALVDHVDGAHGLPFDAVDGMARTSVSGHGGQFVLGALQGVPVLVQQGRVHLYEGHDAATVTASVRAFARLGVRTLLLTNAAGSIEAQWPMPCLMRVTDHVNAQGITPLRAGEEGRGSPYDPALGAVLDAAADQTGVELFHGVYAATLGPAYETPAEVRLFARLGASAVGMSTVAEASAAAVAGMRVAAVSCLGNRAAGISATPLSHAEVLEGGRAMEADFARLVVAAVPGMAA